MFTHARAGSPPRAAGLIILKTALAICRKDLKERNLCWFRTRGLVHVPGEWQA